VVAQEDRPGAVRRNLRGLLHDLDQREAVFLRDRHVHPRHQREVVRRVAFVAVAKVLAHVFRPLVGLGQQEAVLVARIDRGAQLLDDRVRLGQVFVVGAVALDQVRDRVEPEAVYAHVEPEAHGLEDCLQHRRVVEVQVRLVAEEAVPKELLGDRIPGPVRGLGVGEDDARAVVLLVGVAPNIEVALGGARWRTARGLEPRVLVGGVVDHQLGDDLQVTLVRLGQHHPEIVQRAVLRMDVVVARNVVPVVTQRRRVERHQPDRVDAELLDVVKLARDALEVAHAVAVGIEEGLDVQLVDDRVLVPERGVVERHHGAGGGFRDVRRRGRRRGG
jgi:hypothetical protein